MITPQQAKIVKAKVQAELTGVSQREIAKDLYPNATPESANVMVSRELNKVNVQQELEKALSKHGLTADRIMGVVDEAMGANKYNEQGESPDHSIRLKAAGMAANFMGLNKQSELAPSVHFHNHAAEKKTKYDL